MVPKVPTVMPKTHTSTKKGGVRSMHCFTPAQKASLVSAEEGVGGVGGRLTTRSDSEDRAVAMAKMKTLRLRTLEGTSLTMAGDTRKLLVRGQMGTRSVSHA